MYCKNCGKEMNDNQAVCLNCGIASGEGNSYCPHCGNETKPEAAYCVGCGAAIKSGYNSPRIINTAGIQERSIVKAVLFTILTCGIYYIYWFVKLTNELNQATSEPDRSGGVAYLLSLLTCGIYSLYWSYKLGKKADLVAGKNNSSEIIYLILDILGLDIVVMILAQDALNKKIATDRI